ncbi:MAG: LamB/YcsF family protein [Litoreibacter sp.]|nr:LamB/YcsF family protein [Litoreibacter sp.]
MSRSIDLNSDLGESFGPWNMGEDATMLSIVTSANVACGGHASDPETMVETIRLAKDNGVIVGAHPGYADKEGFGRRIIPMKPAEIGNMVAAQIGALQALAQIEGYAVRYVKPHGALGNLCAADRVVADAVVDAINRLDPSLAVLAISGMQLEHAARDKGLAVYSEIFADRGYLSSGQLVPRGQDGAMIHDASQAAARLLSYLESGLMPVIDGNPIPLNAASICVHGDGPAAVAMAREIRARLSAEGVEITPFLRSE